MHKWVEMNYITTVDFTSWPIKFLNYGLRALTKFASTRIQGKKKTFHVLPARKCEVYVKLDMEKPQEINLFGLCMNNIPMYL